MSSACFQANLPTLPEWGLVDVLLLVLTVSPLSSDLFNNTEVDGRIIEVRHDKMG